MKHKGTEARGRLKEAAGALTGDDGLKREGKVDRGEATVREKADELLGSAADKARDAVNDDDDRR